MNINEAIEKIEKEWGLSIVCDRDVINILSQIETSQKPKVSKVAIDYYNQYKDQDFSFEEWFGDLYSEEAEKHFPRLQELTTWLYDNSDEVNRQRELALATLIVNGLDSVEVEKEKLYVVAIPDDERGKVVQLSKDKDGKFYFNFESEIRYGSVHKLTEQEIKQKDERLWQFAKLSE